MILKTHSQKVTSATFQKAEKTRFFTLTGVALGLSLSSVNVYAFDSSLYDSMAKYTFTKVEDYPNVRIYASKTDEYVAVVNLSAGARVAMLQEHKGKHTTKYNEVFNTFARKDIKDFYNRMYAGSSKVLAVNAQYFHPGMNPTTLSYGVVSNGVVVSDSSDPNNAGRNGLYQMNFNRYGPVIVKVPNGKLTTATQGMALIGRHLNDAISPTESKGRTMLCAPSAFGGIKSKNGLLVIYVAKAKTLEQSKESLRSWGCYTNNTLAMDGSGSTQFTTKGGKTLYGNGGYRTIPQALGVFDNAK